MTTLKRRVFLSLFLLVQTLKELERGNENKIIENAKLFIMAHKTNHDHGQSGENEPVQGTGIPTKVNDGTEAADKRLTAEYTQDDEKIAEGVRGMHPNRNVNKGEEDDTQAD